MNNQILALTTWDHDGSAATSPLLIAAGFFQSAGGIDASNIAAWNGSAWSDFGGGVNSYVRALATWDPDGAGGNPPLLIAGGDFTAAGAVPAAGVAGWNGSV